MDDVSGVGWSGVRVEWINDEYQKRCESAISFTDTQTPFATTHNTAKKGKKSSLFYFSVHPFVLWSFVHPRIVRCGQRPDTCDSLVRPIRLVDVECL